MKKITVFTLFVFVLAIFFGVAAAMAQDDSGGMDNTPGGGTSNTPGGGYERQMSMAGNALYAQDDSGGMGMSNATTGMPTLSGDYSSTFESGSMDSAQQICDQLARANSKASCQATSVTTQSTTPGYPPKHLYYCVCK
ncbi:MAG: hypothetical protein M0Z61_10375 [Nitrospiraceae bacterium]|nr:hypothetical protein [Nitrospiraceae bacterium]